MFQQWEIAVILGKSRGKTSKVFHGDDENAFCFLLLYGERERESEWKVLEHVLWFQHLLLRH